MAVDLRQVIQSLEAPEEPVSTATQPIRRFQEQIKRKAQELESLPDRIVVEYQKHGVLPAYIWDPEAKQWKPFQRGQTLSDFRESLRALKGQLERGEVQPEEAKPPELIGKPIKEAYGYREAFKDLPLAINLLKYHDSPADVLKFFDTMAFGSMMLPVPGARLAGGLYMLSRMATGTALSLARAGREGGKYKTVFGISKETIDKLAIKTPVIGKVVKGAAIGAKVLFDDFIGSLWQSWKHFPSVIATDPLGALQTVAITAFTADLAYKGSRGAYYKAKYRLNPDGAIETIKESGKRPTDIEEGKIEVSIKPELTIKTKKAVESILKREGVVYADKIADVPGAYEIFLEYARRNPNKVITVRTAKGEPAMFIWRKYRPSTGLKSLLKSLRYKADETFSNFLKRRELVSRELLRRAQRQLEEQPSETPKIVEEKKPVEEPEVSKPKEEVVETKPEIEEPITESPKEKPSEELPEVPQVAKRPDIVNTHIPELPKDLLPEAEAKANEFAENLGLEYRGLWKVNDEPIGMTFVDKETGYTVVVRRLGDLEEAVQKRRRAFQEERVGAERTEVQPTWEPVSRSDIRHGDIIRVEYGGKTYYGKVRELNHEDWARVTRGRYVGISVEPLTEFGGERLRKSKSLGASVPWTSRAIYYRLVEAGGKEVSTEVKPEVAPSETGSTPVPSTEEIESPISTEPETKSKVGVETKEAIPKEEVKPEIRAEVKGIPVKKPVKVVDTLKTVKSLSTKRTTNPVLEYVKIENGKIMAADGLDVYGEYNYKGKPDGIYEFIGGNLEKTNIPMEEFHVFPSISEFKTSLGTVNRSELINVFNKSLPFVSRKEAYRRYALEGIHINIKKGFAEIVSSDRKALSLTRIRVENSKEGSFTLVNPKSVITALKGLAGEKIKVKIDEKGEYMSFEGDNGRVIVRLEELKFPDYTKVFRTYNKQIIIDRAKLRNAIKVLLPYAKKSHPQLIQIDIRILGNTIRLTAGEKPSKTIELPATIKEVSYKGDEGYIVMPIKSEEGVTFSINGSYLEKVLKGLEGENVFIGFEGKDKPLHFYDRDSSKIQETGPSHATIPEEGAHEIKAMHKEHGPAKKYKSVEEAKPEIEHTAVEIPEFVSVKPNPEIKPTEIFRVVQEKRELPNQQVTDILKDALRIVKRGGNLPSEYAYIAKHIDNPEILHDFVRYADVNFAKTNVEKPLSYLSLRFEAERKLPEDSPLRKDLPTLNEKRLKPLRDALSFWSKAVYEGYSDHFLKKLDAEYRNILTVRAKSSGKEPTLMEKAEALKMASTGTLTDAGVVRPDYLLKAVLATGSAVGLAYFMHKAEQKLSDYIDNLEKFKFVEPTIYNIAGWLSGLGLAYLLGRPIISGLQVKSKLMKLMGNTDYAAQELKASDRLRIETQGSLVGTGELLRRAAMERGAEREVAELRKLKKRLTRRVYNTLKRFGVKEKEMRRLVFKRYFQDIEKPTDLSVKELQVFDQILRQHVGSLEGLTREQFTTYAEALLAGLEELGLTKEATDRFFLSWATAGNFSPTVWALMHSAEIPYRESLMKYIDGFNALWRKHFGHYPDYGEHPRLARELHAILDRYYDKKSKTYRPLPKELQREIAKKVRLEDLVGLSKELIIDDDVVAEINPKILEFHKDLDRLYMGTVKPALDEAIRRGILEPEAIMERYFPRRTVREIESQLRRRYEMAVANDEMPPDIPELMLRPEAEVDITGMTAEPQPLRPRKGKAIYTFNAANAYYRTVQMLLRWYHLYDAYRASYSYSKLARELGYASKANAIKEYADYVVGKPPKMGKTEAKVWRAFMRIKTWPYWKYIGFYLPVAFKNATQHRLAHYWAYEYLGGKEAYGTILKSYKDAYDIIVGKGDIANWAQNEVNYTSGKLRRNWQFGPGRAIDETIGKWAYLAWDYADTYNRAYTASIAWNIGQKLGLSRSETTALAKRLIDLTQFSYTRAGTPMVLVRHPWLRTVPFLKWPLNFMSMLTQMAKMGNYKALAAMSIGETAWLTGLASLGVSPLVILGPYVFPGRMKPEDLSRLYFMPQLADALDILGAVTGYHPLRGRLSAKERDRLVKRVVSPRFVSFTYDKIARAYEALTTGYIKTLYQDEWFRLESTPLSALRLIVTGSIDPWYLASMTRKYWTSVSDARFYNQKASLALSMYDATKDPRYSKEAQIWLKKLREKETEINDIARRLRLPFTYAPMPEPYPSIGRPPRGVGRRLQTPMP